MPVRTRGVFGVSHGEILRSSPKFEEIVDQNDDFGENDRRVNVSRSASSSAEAQKTISNHFVAQLVVVRMCVFQGFGDDPVDLHVTAALGRIDAAETFAQLGVESLLQPFDQSRKRNSPIFELVRPQRPIAEEEFARTRILAEINGVARR